MSSLEPGKPGGLDGPPVSGDKRALSATDALSASDENSNTSDADAPEQAKTPEELAAEEHEKHRRLVAARLIVAGVGLTFLIVGFVDFITKSH
ncbi:hypothetical protein [Subtercola lobariae]|uniref:Uncharacterized protein n=1 Tax=Subtercola lobariae TaxID=1588641 RepID=A0A917EZX2_9MICO|nr:hypothetical protein [Subtercola lobariae]GGF28707.1 hypothetical protein GCM10011399_22330 [Subtercola lobariae]